MALTDNLVSFWELEEASGTRNDSFSTNHLTDNNSTGSAVGKVGNAGSFVLANSNYLSRASNASLQMGDIDFTLAAWVNLSTVNNGMIVAKDSDAANSRDYTFDTLNDTGVAKARFFLNGGGTALIQWSAALSLATWYFIVAEHDATANTVSLQVNNAAVQSAASGGIVPDTSSAEFRIGARVYAGFPDYFNGLIDQVGIWKRKLDASERTDLYNAGAGRSYAYIAGITASPSHNLTLLGCG